MSKLSAVMIAQSTPCLADGVKMSIDDGTGLVRLSGPLFKRGVIRKLLARFFKMAERIEVELDDLGSWVIQRIDGQIDMEGLANQLSGHLKLTYRESEAALTVFVRALLRRKLLRIDVQEGQP